MAKLNTLTAKRQAYKILGEHRLVSLLFNDIALRFKDKTSGYTRILNLTSRRGDGAELVIFELTEIKKKERIKPKKEGKEEIKTKEEIKPEVAKEKSPEEKKPKVQDQTKEKPPISKKPSKNFLGGLRSIFKKERDSL
jgi:large subunit ribosomal protein L17